jgi:diguanylate cyclase (GGDEF)-like protein/PAS domain S-box-containing protein
MFRAFSCLTEAHDWRLVLLAGIICFLASVVAVSLFHRALDTRGHARANRIALAGAATGCGIWATHFIAMMACRPSVPVVYDISLVALSLIAAAVITSLGLKVAAQNAAPWRAPAGGAIIGVGLAAMHYTGMWSLQVPGRVLWSTDLVVASIVLGIAFATAALMVASRYDDIRGTVAGALLLTLAIVLHHFTAMGAVEIAPDPTRTVSGFSLSDAALAVTIAVSALAVLGMSLIAAIADHRLAIRLRQFTEARRQLIDDTEAKLREQNRRLDAAVSNMSQGLCLFDAEERLVLCNQRYCEIYGLSPEQVNPGATLTELLEQRYPNMPSEERGQYIANVYRESATRRSFDKIVHLANGQTIAIANRPLPGGGRVSTHEDITEKRRAEELLREQKLQLDTALNHMTMGLNMFDAAGRLVVFNERYLQMYHLSKERVRPGSTVRDLVEARIEAGTFFTLDPELYIAELTSAMSRRAARNTTVQVHDGRVISIISQPTAGGGWVVTHEDITEQRAREETFELLFMSNPVPMWLYDQDSLRFIAVNDAAIRHYGYSREQFLTLTLLDIRPAGDREAVRALARADNNEFTSTRSWRHLRADGTVIDVTAFRRTLRYEGRIASLVAAIDVTDRKRAEDELRRTKIFLDTVVENMPVMLTVKDAAEQRYVLVNRAAEGLFGIPRDQMIGKRLHDLFPKEEADFFFARDREVLRSGMLAQVGEHVVRTPGQGPRVLTTKKLPILGPDGEPQYLLSLSEDVTDRKRAEARLAHMAHHDALTNLPNRAAFNECIVATIERADREREPFAILCIDLDSFKEINDVFGQSTGDAVLQQVSQRMQAVSEGAVVARLGGDEFTIIATGGMQPTSAATLADRLLTTVAEPFDISGEHVRITISVGVAIFPEDGDDAQMLLGNANAALYRAKADGGGAVRFFEADMDKRLRERRALQHDLRAAVERDELSLHYQPQARMTGEVVGFEALLRWQHPVRGMVPPELFIPLAEESGLITGVGEWILRETCREAASWPKPLLVAVNLSPIQFRHGDLVGFVHSVLLETGLKPERLEVEITEGVLIDNFARAVSILRRLKALGVRIAMDDFGTGYSSLSYLQSFPFDKIKIDQSFISNLETNPQSATIVRAVIGLARGLGLPVVAEGVETKEQVAFLSREKCDKVQGYLIGRPLPIADYADLVGRPRALHARPRKAAR